MTSNRDLVERFWATLYKRDYDGVGAFFAPDGEYTDVCSPADDVAVGPAQIAARIKLGFEKLSGINHEVRLIAVDGDTVITEHAETWEWPTGENVTLPFVSVQEIRGGKIVRWHDYWDMATLMNAAPAWWVEHIMVGYT
jgi:ketosteroid isomerase-like protein